MSTGFMEFNFFVFNLKPWYDFVLYSVNFRLDSTLTVQALRTQAADVVDIDNLIMLLLLWFSL